MATRSGIARSIIGSAAWDAQDVADARRRRPSTDLTSWAARHALQFLGSANANGWSAALPGEPELQFNVVRGTSPGGRDVCLWHCRYPVPLRSGPSGPTLADQMLQDLHLHQPLQRSDRSQVAHVGLPCTTAGVAVPEAALVPAFTVTLRAGLRTATPPAADLLVAGALGPLLQKGSRHAFFELSVQFGRLLLRRNGYTDESGMDELLGLLDDGARALSAAITRRQIPVPFDTRLPREVRSFTGPTAQQIRPPLPQLQQVHRLAWQHRMRLEDPLHYHRAFPTVPVPGTAWAVLGGRMHRTGPFARIVLHTEAPLPDGVGRTGLLLAAEGVPATEPGGVQVLGSPVPLRYAVADGIFAVWVTRNGASGLGSVVALLGPGVAMARRLGVPVD